MQAPQLSKRKRSGPSGAVDDRGEARKLTAACTACRKQKIKCDMINDEPPCTRCQRRSIACVLHTAQRHPLADQKQIDLLGKDIANIFSTLKQVCEHLDLEQPVPLVSDKDTRTNNRDETSNHDDSGDEGKCELSPPTSPSTVQAPMDTYLTSAQRESVPDSAEAQRPRSRRKLSERPDLISKGLISAQDAESLVQSYLSHLDRFLYGIASKYKDADEIRKASPTLLAAICATSAFQDVKRRALFDVCNREYRSLVAGSLFANRSIEYIRALCIGSFWLPDALRILSSEAIRRAADCRLHRQLYRLTEPLCSPSSPSDPTASMHDARDKLRLWYLLYICDQHLSILHNHDPLIRPEKDAIENRDLFLANPDPSLSSQDIRLMSQVSLLVIMGQVRDIFGCEQNRPLPKTLSVQFAHFSRELDQWYSKYSEIFEPDPYIGSFPVAGLTMHHQFGKLYLCHHVFRGLGTDPIPPHFVSVAEGAHYAAVTIFALIVENEAFRNNIFGMPHYFHIMISFAGHFLLDMCMKYREQLNIIVEEDFRRVSTALAFFARNAAITQHPISRVAVGLERKLNDYTATMGMESIMTDSPFGGPEWAAVREFNNDLLNGSTLPASFDMQLTNGVPEDFLYTGLGDMVFQTSDLNFGAQQTFPGS